MEKQQITTFIAEQLAAGNISREDLLNLASTPQATAFAVTPNSESSKEDSSKNIIHVFYGIGAIIAIVGVSILIAQNWHEIGLAGRIMATMGISLVTYLAALFLRGSEQKAISQTMFVISAALAPLGVYVLLNESKIDFTAGVQFMAAMSLLIIFGSALFISKKPILSLIAIGFGSWAYWSLVIKIFEHSSYTGDVIKWASMFLGIAYLLIARGIRSLLTSFDQSNEKESRSVEEVLYAFGTLAILGAGIAIGGIFDLFFIALIFGAFYGSIYLKDRSMLILGALFLMAHIIKLTSKYFANSVGWPIALIIVGFLVIGVGYLTFYLNKKFIATN